MLAESPENSTVLHQPCFESDSSGYSWPAKLERRTSEEADDLNGKTCQAAARQYLKEERVCTWRVRVTSTAGQTKTRTATGMLAQRSLQALLTSGG